MNFSFIRKILSLIILISILYCCIPSLCFSQVQTETKALKVLSWNIYMLPSFIKPSHKKRRAKEIGRILNESEYDVLVLQESFKRRCRKLIWKRLRENYPFQAGPANLKTFSLKTNSGIWILSKIPIRDEGEIQFDKCLGFVDCFGRKGALMVSMEWEGREIQIVGTHLQSAGPDTTRHLQMQELWSKLIQPKEKDGVPQLICGDMNTLLSDKESYGFMLKALQCENGELTGEVQCTADAKLNDLCEWGNGEVIDYIFYRGNGVVPDKMERRVPMIRSDWSRNHQDLSDHFPVELQLWF